MFISGGNRQTAEDNTGLGPTPSKRYVKAFDLDLSSLEVNSPVIIKIFHNDNCRPRILNPNAIRTKDDFTFTDISVNTNGVTWKAKGEKKFGKFFVMPFHKQIDT